MGRKKKNIEEPSKNKLNDVIRGINKKFGVNSIKFGRDLIQAEKIPFGVKELDDLLGGGIPYGYFTTLWGASSSGKTTLAYNLIVSAQKLNKTPLYIALEPFDKDRAFTMGVDVDNLMVATFPIAEESLDTIIEVSKKKVVDVIILDSIHSLSPKREMLAKSVESNEIEEDTTEIKSVENESMALLASRLSQFFRMATHFVSTGKVAVLLIGQTRTNIGFIALDKLSGGNALLHYSKLILHIRRGQKADAPTEKYKEDGKTKSKIVGFNSVIKIDKTQITGTKPELSEIDIPYYFESGFLKEDKNE